ncbi:TonB-dependent receptor plug domain-containing protein [Methylobacterium sp. J-026]|uniref:TonB-dependent receptor family protein n=1 Tax=Methylobacterium sp. J-026 TaxID=2836624 RepID=UPI001FB9740E|nr:TonB-dependent receptor [Methylobacterium sp. J-026]MCJ2136308.1 TonB-dependent receptor plug domain-containing protein [Methylobacterium sp. J-026]
MRSPAFLALCACAYLGTDHAAAQTGRPRDLEELSVVLDRAPTPADAEPWAARGDAGPTPPGGTAPGVGITFGGAATTITRRDAIADRPAADIGSILLDSPGVTVRQGTGGRDVIVSIRGANARSTGVNRSIAVVEDGFPLTQPDGGSRFDLTDPHAYADVTVLRGPQSALFGNYATGGAIAFRTRTGAEIDGYEIGADAGSFGYLNTYAAAGRASGPFDLALFLSDARANGYQDHASYDTQTVNLIARYAPTPDDRFTIKAIDNQLHADVPARASLAQYRINPYQRGCAAAATAAPGCTTYAYFANGAYGATVAVTASEAALLRDDRRTVLGLRYEHDLDAFTTWSAQAVLDERNFFQPFYTASPQGSYPSQNLLTDVTRRADLFGLPATGYAALSYDRIESHAAIYTRAPYSGPRLGALTSDQRAVQDNLGARARVELQLSERWSVAAGLGAQATGVAGRNIFYTTTPGGTAGAGAGVDRTFLNAAQDLSLTYRPSADWRFLARAATAYATPAATSLFITPAGIPGNNTLLRPQRNLGLDLGATWMPLPGLQLSITGFYEFLRDELVSQSPGGGLLPFIVNAPASEHRGVEVRATWASPDGWRATLAYTHDDQVYTRYTEQLSAGARTATFDRVGRHIPGVPVDAGLVRLGHEWTTGLLHGFGAFVEAVSQSGFPLDNANVLKAPGFGIVNLNVHYDRALSGRADAGFAKRVSVYVEARNVLGQVYTNAAQNVADTISAVNGQPNGARVLAQATGSVFAGAPRNIVGGVRVAF